MLTHAQQAQLTNWLIPGAFTNIFTHVPGDGKLINDFMAATAGKGRTITLLHVAGSSFGVPSNLPPQVIGGFNPQSWTPGEHLTPTDAERTAFIFNLTNTTIQRQNLIGQGAVDSGKVQTIAAAAVIGFGFGGGNRDIMVHWELNQGWARNYSYGGSGGAPITMGGAADNLPTDDTFQISRIEVYTV